VGYWGRVVIGSAGLEGSEAFVVRPLFCRCFSVAVSLTFLSCSVTLAIAKNLVPRVLSYSSQGENSGKEVAEEEVKESLSTSPSDKELARRDQTGMPILNHVVRFPRLH